MVVSDDSDFVEVFQEATLRCLKMFVVGDMSDGALKRIVNAFFFLERFINGKVIRKEVVSVVMEGLGCFEEIGVDL
ncbi:hypothetical protein CUMW_278730 [Citrus unshiu]|uniref:NYN domain-containing protein n=1 Tax=Citrus unshiu TaxID=55188 RepID=A0A2H5N673_CITUN|nr:hypothetical protein CUMW_278730 [Citrus unshiu]